MEGKLFHQFDHRFASYWPGGDVPSDVIEKGSEQSINFYRYIPREIALRRNPQLSSVSSFVALRDITNRANERGLIAAVIPANITDYTVRVLSLSCPSSEVQLFLVALMNSFILDYLARQRVGGTHLSNDCLEQLPVPTHDEVDRDILAFLIARSFELTYTSWDLEPLARELNVDCGPFRWNSERRFTIRCELDAAFLHIYGVNRNDAISVMETFPIVRRKDEERYGTYKTKDTILEIYDSIAESKLAGRPYETPLRPTPAHPSLCHKSH